MKRYLKAGLLTLVLVLPALIVLFLHGFAENHFTLPYLQPLVDSTGTVVMNGLDTVFYQVPKAVEKNIKVVAFFGENPSNQLIQQFSRVEKLASDDVKVEALKGENVEKDATEIYKIKPLIKAKSAENILYNEQFILIDKEGYTRGVYDGTDPEDVDRLLAELKILIDIYNKGKD
jgi:protein SCO1/2